MGKAKRALRRHERDIARLIELMRELVEFFNESTLSPNEFVGNLEAVKAMVYRSADDIELHGLMEAIRAMVGEVE